MGCTRLHVKQTSSPSPGCHSSPLHQAIILFFHVLPCNTVLDFFTVLIFLPRLHFFQLLRHLCRLFFIVPAFFSFTPLHTAHVSTFFLTVSFWSSASVFFYSSSSTPSTRQSSVLRLFYDSSLKRSPIQHTSLHFFFWHFPFWSLTSVHFILHQTVSCLSRITSLFIVSTLFHTAQSFTSCDFALDPPTHALSLSFTSSDRQSPALCHSCILLFHSHELHSPISCHFFLSIFHGYPSFFQSINSLIVSLFLALPHNRLYYLLLHYFSYLTRLLFLFLPCDESSECLFSITALFNFLLYNTVLFTSLATLLLVFHICTLFILFNTSQSVVYSM